jgi:ribonuclease HI
MALLEAMREAVARGWTNIIFKSDSKVVVDAVQTNHQRKFGMALSYFIYPIIVIELYEL